MKAGGRVGLSLAILAMVLSIGAARGAASGQDVVPLFTPALEQQLERQCPPFVTQMSCGLKGRITTNIGSYPGSSSVNDSVQRKLKASIFPSGPSQIL